jgi:hypothetical protein
VPLYSGHSCATVPRGLTGRVPLESHRQLTKLVHRKTHP